MTDHYYSRNPSSKRDSRDTYVKVLSKEFTLKTDSGVFSKRTLDYGTKLLIENIHLENSEKILDLGCGYGPIGISIANMNPHLSVTMVDINQRAIDLANTNIKMNNVEKNTTLKESDFFSNLGSEKYDVIITNPPIRVGKERLYNVFEESLNHLHQQGELWLVIRKQQGADSAIKFLKTIFTEVTIVVKSKGYFVVSCKRA